MTARVAVSVSVSVSVNVSMSVSKSARARIKTNSTVKRQHKMWRLADHSSITYECLETA